MQDTTKSIPSDRVLIGKIVKVRGLRGDLKILPFTWRPERFNDLDKVWLISPEGESKLLSMKRIRVEGQMVFVRFVEAATRELAEELVGYEVYIDENQRDSLPENHYYLDDLVGCEIICSQNGNVGKIKEIMDLPANDVWVVIGKYGEVLIPAIREIVEEVDIKNKKINVTLFDGLIDEPEEADQP
jgi:16S rRNA processing protein RimM